MTPEAKIRLLEQELADTVNQLMERHGLSLQAQVLIHSDQSAHYTSVKFVQLVKDSRLRQSMSRRANCWDNAPPGELFRPHEG